MSKTLRRRSTDKGRRTKGRRTKRKVTKRKVTNKSKSRLRTKHRTRNNRLKKNNRLRSNHSFKTYNGGVGLAEDLGNLGVDLFFPNRRQGQEFNERYPHLHNKLEPAINVGNVARHPRRKLNEYRDSLREQRQGALNELREHANINRNRIIHNRGRAGLQYLNRVWDVKDIINLYTDKVFPNRRHEQYRYIHTSIINGKPRRKGCGKIKNSWSSEWGEDGYMRLLKGSDSSEGQCGIVMDASYLIIKLFSM